MEYATRENIKEGDTVLVPLYGEEFHDEQICQEYEVVLALRKKKGPKMVGIDQYGKKQKPLPEFIQFRDEIAYRK